MSHSDNQPNRFMKTLKSMTLGGIFGAAIGLAPGSFIHTHELSLSYMSLQVVLSIACAITGSLTALIMVFVKGEFKNKE